MKEVSHPAIRIFFSSAVFLFIVEFGYSQPGSLTLYSLTESDGLSDNRVASVFQDHQGFMWIGTEDGLNRYDGSVFKVFKRRKNSVDELADNHVHAVAEDAQHHLWIATQHGLSEYNPEENSFRSWQCDLDRKDINVMLDVWPDDQGNIWIGTFGGLLQFIIAQHKFIPHFISSGDVLENRVMDIHIDRKGRFWLATYKGLWRFDRDKKNFEHALFGKNKSASADLISAIAEGSDGRLWMGYWSGGLKCFDPETGEGEAILQPGLPSHVGGVANVRNPKGGFDIWYGTLVRVDGGNNATPYTTRINPPSINSHVSKLYSASDGLLWLCSDRGVLIMDPAKQFFHHRYFPNQITHQGIVVRQKDNDVYVGGAGENFLKRYDSTFHLVKPFPLRKGVLPDGAPALLSIVREDADHIWLCTEEGLLLMDESSGEQRAFRLSEQECEVPTRNFINTMFIDSHNDHWIFPWRGGIWRFDQGSKKFTQIIRGLEIESGKTKGFLIADAVEDSLNNLWFADLDEGLIYFNRSKRSFSKPTDRYFKTRYSLSNVLYERPYIWAAISGFVFRLHERTQAFEQWSIPEEWNKTVTGFQDDRQNHLWITTRSGLLSFDKTTHQFKHFTVNDGLIDDMMVGSIYCLRNGKIIYGDANYFTVFDPRELVKSSEGPPVLITGLLSQNRPLQIHVDDAQKKYVDLDYTHNNFTFDWAALHYSNPMQNRYYCKLEGVDPAWRYVGNTGRVQYASLSPGRYVFKARGATSDGITNELGDEIIILIRPPFWKSSWFFFACGFMFIGLTYSWYRYRLNEALKTEKLRNKISTDLHDEIGSTLSSISIMSNLVAQKTLEEKTLEVVTEIKENALVLMERMDDIVWSINPKNDSLENLLLRVKRFAAQLFEAKNIDYEIRINPNVQQVKLPMEYRQNIYLILKEAINNLVRHARCSKANIEVTQEQSTLTVEIVDNGIGFDPDGTEEGNGIASMKNRAEKMGVKFSIESGPGMGTAVRLALKIR